jgi:hypothetical protein
VPFLRVIRDKRGYETTYLMHWYREGNRQRSRILYVFRTPGGVRVGRAALDSDVQRQIEQRYPDIAFDWAVVRDNQQLVDSTPDLRPRRGDRRPRREESDAPALAPGSVPLPPTPPAPREPPAPQVRQVREGAPSREATPSATAAPSLSRPPIPAAIEGATPDEQIAFLAQWYPIVRDRIPSRTTDPTRQEMLLELAERLNATAWTDADQITTGLQKAGEALERLSRVLAKRRRRARKRPTGAARDAASAGAGGDAGPADDMDGANDEAPEDDSGAEPS